MLNKTDVDKVENSFFYHRTDFAQTQLLASV